MSQNKPGSRASQFIKQCARTIAGWTGCMLLSLSAQNAQSIPQRDQIQQAIDAIKDAHYSEAADYHTDGNRVVWVKSYKKWTPRDLAILKKEDPAVLKFLSQAIDHKRYDVLEQLLPDYYRSHGGVTAFSAEILRAGQGSNAK